VLAIFILISGGLAILRTPKDIFPNINIPVVAVVWTYTGMEPTDITDHVTSVYERVLTTTADQLIVNPSDSLNDGMKVHVVDSNQNSGSIAEN
jgi:multidrug efflux pump subunit AcrB